MVDKIACAVLDGGLGNQLFQYACTYAMAMEHSRGIRFFADAVRARGAHGTLMINDVFNMPFCEFGYQELGCLSRSAIGHKQKGLMNRFKPLRIAFPEFVFDGQEQEALAGKRDIERLFCAGYHQDESVFSKHAPSLFHDLSYHEALEEHYIKAAARLNGMAVLHVRLGDYVASPKNKRIYSQLSVDYYKSSLSALNTEGAGSADILLISDDVPQAKERLSDLGRIWTIKELGLQSDGAKDFVSLSAASRLVIANSTYSWWAGRIAEARGGAAVKGPSNWYVDQRKPNPVPIRWLA